MDLNTLAINQVNPINVYVNKVAGQEVEAIDADANKLYSLAKTAPSDNQIMRFVGGNGEFITSSAYPISYTITPYQIVVVATNVWEGLTPNYQNFAVGKYAVSGYIPYIFGSQQNLGAVNFRFSKTANPPSPIVCSSFYVKADCSYGLSRPAISLQSNAVDTSSVNTVATEDYLTYGLAFSGYFTVSVAGGMRPEVLVYAPTNIGLGFTIPAGAFISYTKLV